MAQQSFHHVLNDLIAEKGVNAKTLAQVIGVSSATVSHWRAGKYSVQLPNLVAIARYFNCSLEYLAGRTAVAGEPPRPIDPLVFAKHVRAIMKRKRISNYRLRKASNLGARQYDWDKGASPKLDTLIELACQLGCTLDELVRA